MGHIGWQGIVRMIAPLLVLCGLALLAWTLVMRVVRWTRSSRVEAVAA